MPWEEDFTTQIQNRALLEQIEAYVSGLEPQTQAVFRLRLYGEQSFPEIAAALGMSVESVNTRLSRGRDRLRRELTEKGVYSHA